MADSYLPRVLLGTAAAAALGLVPASAHAAFLTNGDFETEPVGNDAATTTFPNWTESGANAVNAPAAIAGAHSAKLLAGPGNMAQSTDDPSNLLSTYTLDLDFAASDPGGATNRSFHLNVRHAAPSGGLFFQINVRVVDLDADGDGDVQVFNSPTGSTSGTGVAWVTVLPNAVTFSASDTSLGVNHLTIVGDYSDASPSYDLTVNGATAPGLTTFHGTPTAGQAVEAVTFETGSSQAGSFYVVDNVTVVPEPGAAAGLLPAASLLRMRRRRRHC